MAVINLIKFGHSAGALIADEEQWHQGVRRLLSFDNLQSLLDEKLATDLGVEAVFGAIGTPSLGSEGALRIRNKLLEKSKAKDGAIKEIKTIAGIAKIAVTELRMLMRERANQILNFCFGFSSDDVIRGYFEADGSKIDIKQEAVLKEAQALATLSPTSALLRSVVDHESIIAGYDREKGFTWTVFSAKEGVNVGSGAFESIGKGSDLSTLELIAFAGRKTLSERRQQFDRLEAMVALIRAFNAAIRFNHEVGGYPLIIIIDGEAESRSSRYRELVGHRTKLACEIVAAMDHKFVNQDLGHTLVTDLLFNAADDQQAEQAFFSAAADSYALEHFLRGYKLDCLPRRDSK